MWPAGEDLVDPPSRDAFMEVAYEGESAGAYWFREGKIISGSRLRLMPPPSKRRD
jgi:hypothetical protein